MSVGVNVLLTLVERAAAALGAGFDPEIVEIHHRMKVDAPSGTALALGRAVAAGPRPRLRAQRPPGREGIVGKRTDEEIGIVALRGGDVVGDHTVVFAGMGERLELTHRAQSRDCLARGAVRAGALARRQARRALRDARRARTLSPTAADGVSWRRVVPGSEHTSTRITPRQRPPGSAELGRLRG